MGYGGGFTERTREWIRKLRGRQAKHEEVSMLQPVALAGASRRSEANSRLCSSFATTAPTRGGGLYASWGGERSSRSHSVRRKALSDGAEVQVEWAQCQMCERNFVVGLTPYRHHCSLDCKSASLLEQPVLLQSD